MIDNEFIYKDMLISPSDKYGFAANKEISVKKGSIIRFVLNKIIHI